MHLRLITLTISFLALFLAYPAPAKVVYVSQDAAGDGSGTSWENARTTVTAGLAGSASGDEIWVKSAVYPEAITLVLGVALYGGFEGNETTREERDWTANETIIDADGLNTHALVAADGTLVDGLTIRGGLAERGGGVYSKNASLTLAHCTITGNRAEIPQSQSGTGGGIHCVDGSLTITDSTITGNSAEAVGGIYLERSPLTMTNCTSSSNDGINAGMRCEESPAIVTDCTFAGNTGRGHGVGANFNYSSAVLTRCTVASNTSTGAGGLYFYRSPATLVDCVITDNVGGVCGGALFYVSGESVIAGLCETAGEEGVDCRSLYPTTLTNCLVTGNQSESALYTTGGLDFVNIAPTLTNCTIAKNTQPGLTVDMNFYETGPYTNVFCGCNNVPILNNCIIWDWIDLPSLRYGDFPIESDERLEISNSCLKFEIPESGYINDDPLFVNPAGGDYRLQADSPCIDSGSNELALGIPTDLDGNTRIMDGDSDRVSTVDMGAYEFQPPPPPPPELWILDSLGQVHQLPPPTPTP